MKKKKLRYAVTAEQHAYMAMRQKQNLRSCKYSAAESWMENILRQSTNIKWTRQARWGYRIFDFWCGAYGVAIEVDGPEHNKAYDEYRDRYNFERSGIVVLRVRNFNDGDAAHAVETLKDLNLWIERRKEMGILTKAEKKKLGLPIDKLTGKSAQGTPEL